ncbi:MAG: ferrous iron transport protein A [Bdellovibrionales bacterium]|nr:ferrous iron transport protein A [Bdellovibrionales bacterium]
MTLSHCVPGDRVRVSAVDPDQNVSQRLFELGFLPGAVVDVVHEAPFSKDPMAIRVRGTLIALRRSEAELIRVEKT